MSELYSDDEVQVTASSVTYKGQTFQIKTLPTVSLRNTGPGCSYMAGVGLLALVGLFSAIEAFSASGAGAWGVFLLCVIGLAGMGKNKPADTWQVYTKIGLDEKTLFASADKDKAEKVHAAIRSGMEA